MRKATNVFFVFVLTGIACLFHIEPRVFAMPAPQTANSALLDRFLTDRNIWGEDAFQVFASLDRWRAAGESAILIFTDRVVGGSKFEAPEQAREKATGMARSINRANAKLTPNFANSYKAALARKTPALQVESARFIEDDSYRLQ